MKIRRIPPIAEPRRARRVAPGWVAGMALLGVAAASINPAATAVQPYVGAPSQAYAAWNANGAVQPPTKPVTRAELDRAHQVPATDLVHKARALPIPTTRPGGTPAAQGPDGPEARVDGTREAASGVSAAATSTTATIQNGAWPGSYAANPNRQIGKLYFDIQPGPRVDWRHCTATALNSENKSLIITAGHCVYTPDPDENGRVEGNGYWHEQVQFCPGYEYGCKLGVWYARQLSTTNTWFYGFGTNHNYDFRDDAAVVLVKPNTSGYLVNVVGGQGIIFNAATGLQRYALGYPAADSRWPAYSYDGEDLIYCAARDTNDTTIPGTMWIPCTMTGGASGGPWLTSPNSSWWGYVNSVNSHKPYGGAYTSGPYFGTAESNLFQYWRSR